MIRYDQQSITVGFVALGCPKNIVDSERMLADIAQAGMLISEDPDRADVVVINTCGFIEPAKEESIAVIRRAVTQKRKGQVKKVVVAGCLSQRIGDALFQEVPGIDAIVGLEQRDNISNIILDSFGTSQPGAYMEPLLGRSKHEIGDDSTRLLIGPRHSAYLRISEGCNHTCTFCTIPSIRGPFRSKPQAQAVEEARELVESGVVELNIVSQDTTTYERDLKQRHGLARLLEQLATLDQLDWIRLMYIYPAGISDRLIETIQSSDKIIPYLDMPTQHANDGVLKAMKRADTQARLRDLIERLRREIPDIVIRTTVIVGFPGETEEAFSELLEFIKWAQYDALGAFQYYRERGTPAAAMDNQVPASVKKERLERLMLAQQEIAFAKNSARVGSRISCLIDTISEEGTATARYYGQAPDIDSVCLIPNCTAQPGEFVEGRVVDYDHYDLLVKQD